MAVLGCMLALLRPTGERIVVVSNSTQVLDLIGQLCRECAVRTSHPLIPSCGINSMHPGWPAVDEYADALVGLRSGQEVSWPDHRLCQWP